MYRDDIHILWEVLFERFFFGSFDGGLAGDDGVEFGGYGGAREDRVSEAESKGRRGRRIDGRKGWFTGLSQL